MNSPSKQYVIIVDPFSSGAAYSPVFSERGYLCVAVRSSPNIAPRFARQFRADHFLDGRLFDIDEALTSIGGGHIAAVIAGCEMGVVVAEALAARLGVRGNSPHTTALRRQKYDMQEALSAAGLRHIPSTLVQRQEDIDASLHRFSDEDYVVKPLNSASTDGVCFTRGRFGVAETLRNAAWGKVNDLGEINHGFVVQPFIQGAEYVVDIVAHAAGYTVASVCVYHKINRNGSPFVYAGLELLDACDSKYTTLIEYALQAAAALNVSVGPLHMELIWSEQGPVMIEAGARLHGGVAPQLFEECCAPHLLDLAVRAYLDLPITESIVERVQAGRIVFLINDQEVSFPGESLTFVSQLKSLSTYRGHKLFVSPGDQMRPTVDLATCPGIIWLVDTTEAAVVADAQQCHILRLNEVPKVNGACA